MVMIALDNDADKTIVLKSLENASQGKYTSVVANDTDILVLLLNMWQLSMSNIFIRHEARKGISLLPTHVRSNLLFIHAWGGCDTTSSCFGQGKTAAMKLVEQNSILIKKVCLVFNNLFATQEQVSSAGIQFAIKAYGENNEKGSLALMRKYKYMQMATSSFKDIQPERPPPTEDAIRYHSLKVDL
ncbi:uncharacterized protein LOC124805886 [Hydra vulgaris]|uniref:uncharacterized protein LOC124805886 n=1 Tax=Hydra vulgaris TaxID=6087 RepID=UPI0032EA355A